MTSVALSDIPGYLRNSAFYKSLNVEDEREVIQVPEGCIKADTSIESVADFKVLLSTAMYWGVDDILPVFLDYCCANDSSLWHAAVLEVERSELQSDLLFLSEEMQSYYGPLEGAISTGRAELVKYFCANELFPRNNDAAVIAAIRHDRLNALKVLHENGYILNCDAFTFAATEGRLDCVQYIYEVIKKRDDQGSIEECLKGLDVPCLMENVAHAGHCDVFTFLLETFPDEDRGNSVTHAAWGGSVECLKLLYALGDRCDEDFFGDTDEVSLEVMVFRRRFGASGRPGDELCVRRRS
jgi:hypothetical protein